MNIIDLKSETINARYVAGNSIIVNRVIQLITRLRNQTNIIAKRVFKELEEYGSAASYAIHR